MTIGKIQAFTRKIIDRELAEKKQLDFLVLRNEVQAEFPGKKFNWLTAVRSPMQEAINAGRMRRTKNVHVEVYEATK